MLVLVVLLTTSMGFAQNGNNDSLKNGVVVISKDYEPRISDAFKLSDVPKVIDTVIRIDNNVPYDVKTKRALTSFHPEPIKPARMKGEPLSKLYRAYALIGFGNYLSNNVELVLNNTRSRKWDYGL
ncbi:MAG: hypothetical protein ACKVJP_11720, partial [Flavobacteriales bacterium]